MSVSSLIDRALPDGSVVVLHACAHNPTGIDPSPDEMAKIVDLCKAKRHLPILDSAYQGMFSYMHVSLYLRHIFLCLIYIYIYN